MAIHNLNPSGGPIRILDEPNQSASSVGGGAISLTPEGMKQAKILHQDGLLDKISGTFSGNGVAGDSFWSWVVSNWQLAILGFVAVIVLIKD